MLKNYYHPVTQQVEALARLTAQCISQGSIFVDTDQSSDLSLQSTSH